MEYFKMAENHQKNLSCWEIKYTCFNYERLLLPEYCRWDALHL